MSRQQGLWRSATAVACSTDGARRARAGFDAIPVATALLLSIGYAFALFHRTAFLAIAPLLAAEFRLTPSETADLASVFFWTYLLVMIPTGILADAIGARRVAAAGFVVTSMGALLFRSADSVIDLTCARMLVAAGAPAAFVGLMRYVAVAFPERKATYSGRGILVGNIGAVCSGAPLALLLAALAWGDVWLFAGIASLLLALALILVGTSGAVPPSPRASAGDPWRELTTLLRSRSVLLGVALQAGLAGAYYAFANVLASRWLAARGFSAVDAGWVISMLIAGYGLGAAFWGWFGDREHQRRRALLMASLLAVLGWMSMAWLPVSGGVAAGLLFLVIGLACGAFVLIYALITERHPPGVSGGVIACVNCGIPLGAALLSSVIGRLGDDPAPWALCVAGAVPVLGSCALLFERRGEMPVSLRRLAAAVAARWPGPAAAARRR